jgi:glycosyltransferase involved in cell wall biosynthesis
MCRIPAISRQHELAVVMPVYNEEGCIGRVVSAWRDMFRASGIDFVMLVIDDGSSDRTGEILLGFAGDDRIRVIAQANRGHGPTILGGYRQAVQLAEWVFQCDSDDEMSPDSFAGLWDVRRQADAVFGCRQGRRQSLQRKAISFGSRLAVDILFGRGVRDVNTPYRLLRTSVLRPVLDSIPSDTFAPNLVITGALNLSRGRVLSVPVPFQPRQSGHVSIVRWGLWKAAFRSFWQTVCCSRRIRRQENLRGHASSAPSCEHE